ncbi:MAG: lipoyl(octanoyl) transferase LipB [Candidatus Eremiobacteraeota bacterium]|nr:lipoyl(octanoyl) transferase LipB [Candidatus Eremiobacteraeota bacterium]MCW5871196.1 lipoyl(octanoyl) transferase LipB [Candidatus Eremiobacteraeota bacterium]
MLQQDLVQRRKHDEIGDQLLLLEHPPVYTLGRGASLENLKDARIQPVHTGRGGEITYHGPGQLIAYPILLLEEGRRDLHRYLRDLEQVVIDLCADYDLRAGREAGKTGVWLDGKKLASIGVRAASWVTSHGVALNYGQDLTGFDPIVPCGLQGVEMISLSQILGEVARDDLEDRFCRCFSRIFGREIL